MIHSGCESVFVWGGTQGGDEGLNGFQVVSTIKEPTLSFPDTLGSCTTLECEAVHSPVYGCDCRSVSWGSVSSWAPGREYDCLLVFAVTITTLPRWRQRIKSSVSVVQITDWSRINFTLLQNKVKNEISLNHFFISSHHHAKSFSSTNVFTVSVHVWGEKTVFGRKGNSHYWKLLS